jgi:hypothetical protein
MRKLNEAIGANSMEQDPADLILNPDTKRASAMMFHQGSSGAVPAHWNNSPFLTGGRLTSAFGANPSKKEKFRIKKYKDFIKDKENKVSESYKIPTFKKFVQ